jgi:hypothetical protein
VVATGTHRRSEYVGYCCVALALTGCPQLLSDDFLLGRGRERSDAGLAAREKGGAGGAGGHGGPVTADAGTGEQPDAALAGSSDASGVGQPVPTCNDGTRNGNETGVDCGGSLCTPCNCQYGPFHDIVQVDGLGSDDRWGAMLSADGSWLYYSVQSPSGGEDIYRASRSDTGTVFANAQLVPNVNGSSLEGSPFLTADGLTLYFFSDRSNGVGNRDLWTATRASATDAFATPTILPGVNSTAMDLLPRLSLDGLTLMFESTRPGGSGSSDLWQAERPTASGTFGTPHARTDLNTSGREEGFSLSGDQLTIVLSSNRGVDSMDLWMATRSSPSASFGTPVPISELNGSADELDPGLSRNGGEIFFTTTRDTDYRIYHAVRDCQ